MTRTILAAGFAVLALGVAAPADAGNGFSFSIGGPRGGGIGFSFGQPASQPVAVQPAVVPVTWNGPTTFVSSLPATYPPRPMRPRGPRISMRPTYVSATPTIVYGPFGQPMTTSPAITIGNYPAGTGYQPIAMNPNTPIRTVSTVSHGSQGTVYTQQVSHANGTQSSSYSLQP